MFEDRQIVAIVKRIIMIEMATWLGMIMKQKLKKYSLRYSRIELHTYFSIECHKMTHNIMNKTNEQTFNNSSTQFLYPKSTRARIKQPKCQINRIYYHLRVCMNQKREKRVEEKKKDREKCFILKINKSTMYKKKTV